ncbi:hypothetical protein [Microbacterium deminutum]|uniref:NADH:ubiquinone oxidoreductase n=1 Tax=Microbacterium deminutum TaxID=344164 RepID=A0ABP5CA47_9MICO
MRRYLFSTGLFSAILSGLALLRSMREKEPFTWRTALAWLSWGISVTLAVGAAVDTRRARRGREVAEDSPIAPKAEKLYKKRLDSARAS